MSDLLASRELDALVAEKVMGWRWWTASCYETRWLEEGDIEGEVRSQLCGKVRPWSATDHDDAWRGPEPFGGPEYSTDIAAAWLVVEKWNADPDRCCNIAWNLTIATVEPYWSAAFWEKDMVARYIGNADTAPLAICRAALAAVGAA